MKSDFLFCIVPMRPSDVVDCGRIVEFNYDVKTADLATNEMLHALRGISPQPFYFVAKSEGEVIGVVGVASSFMNSRIHEVFWVNVDPAHQRKGVGAALVEKVKHHAFVHEAESVMLTAKATLIPFYTRLGFATRGPVGNDNFDDTLMEAKQ